MPVNQKNLPLVLPFTLAGLVVGLILGMFFARYTAQKNIPYLGKDTGNSQTTGEISDSLFNDQTALINGQITSINGDKITVENFQKKQGEFTLGNPVYISKQSSNPKDSSPSTDLKRIELNQYTIVNLHKVDGVYKVRSMIFLPPIASPPPISIPPKASPSPKK